MQSLILLAHGSRSGRANQEVAALAQRLGAAGAADRVIAAYLEIAHPRLPEAVRAEVFAGSDSIIILPMFLHSGRHVTLHVPELVSAARAEFPSVEIRALQHLGASEMFIASIERFVRAGLNTASDTTPST